MGPARLLFSGSPEGRKLDLSASVAVDLEADGDLNDLRGVPSHDGAPVARVVLKFHDPIIPTHAEPSLSGRFMLRSRSSNGALNLSH
jgi:hypothetical protein